MSFKTKPSGLIAQLADEPGSKLIIWLNQHTFEEWLEMITGQRTLKVFTDYFVAYWDAFSACWSTLKLEMDQRQPAQIYAVAI